MPWSEQFIFLIAAAGAVAVTMLLLGGIAYRRFTSRFRLAAVLLIIATGLVLTEHQLLRVLALPADSALGRTLVAALGVAWWLTMAWMVVQCVNAFIWSGLLRGATLPRLLTDAVDGIVWLLALFAVISVVFGQPVTGLLATSGVVAIVLGLALQNTLADMFSGIALNISAPFRIGDWIETDGNVSGRVIEVDWRATRIRTRDDTVIMVPNSQLARQKILNTYHPTKVYAAHVRLRLGYEVDPARARQVLHAAALAVPKVRTDPPPLVRAWEFLDWAVLYDVRYHLDDYADDPDVKQDVVTSIWHHLHWAGIRIATPQSHVTVGRRRTRSELPPSAPERLLEGVALFAPLPTEAREQLTGRLRRRAVAAGITVGHQGDAGASLFIVAEGILSVTVDARPVARLVPGQVFGEMSLMTGEPRSAAVAAAVPCVLYEVDKTDIAPLLDAYPDLVERLGGVLAQRRAANAAASGSHAGTSNGARDFGERIRAFFGLRHRG